MVIDTDNFFMSLAITEAWKYQGLTYPNPAVGCSIVLDKKILSVSAHKKAGLPHAEVNALQEAYYKLTDDTSILSLKNSAEIHTFLLNKHNGIFHNVVLYTTLEPCSHQGKTPSCASLISALGIKKVYVGSRDFNPVAKAGNNILKNCGCSVKSGVLQRECDALLEPFKAWQESSFIFFKWAQRLDGSVDGGVISSIESREHVHALRDRCDLLIVGGETVRVDRPTLDARLVNGKAPDILIYSRRKDFDRNIPLFNVANRQVIISDELSSIKKYKNIMIEGGPKLFALTREIVDYYLSYIAPSFGGKSSIGIEIMNFDILNIQKETQDIMMWMKLIEGNE
ncbi:MAG: bifunctional diaminohydroxyphosphoribosylaminopyrimidine deaminase/5-amino-6-(5-phosphoribosylamino)uracil reductase RibD [Campylobacterales bacterium]|nr:bifunctional diaminohydroxyphosphoribosylaminopyrimidine deaminase/5-amino-6-(5-phosphoribosylamino)uracil reductase RibD [Campylobacterales bacterium]